MSRTTSVTILFALAVTVFASASSHGAKAESSAKRASESGVWVIHTYKVYDYDRWKPVHDRSASIRRDFGCTKSTVFAVDGNRNHVMVMEQFGALDRARAFAESTALRDEMAASGVSSNPEVRFVNALGGEAL